MSQLEGIRGAIIDSLASLNINHSDGYLMAPLVPPCFEVDFPDPAVNYDTTYGRGSDTMFLIVRGVVQVGDTHESQRQLDEWLDPTGSTSVKAMLQNNPTLSGNADDMRVTQVSGIKRLAAADKPGALLLCAEWTLEILT